MVVKGTRSGRAKARDRGDVVSRYWDPDVPRDLTTREIRKASIKAPAGSKPVVEVAADERGTWQRDKRILALWSSDNDRNSWAWVDGVGWKKLAYTSTTTTLALTALASAAKQNGSRVDYREEADGTIHEMYVW